MTATRGRHIAASIIDDLVFRLAGHVDDLRALIASTNTASLALHASRGFAERGRRTVYETRLPVPARLGT